MTSQNIDLSSWDTLYFNTAVRLVVDTQIKTKLLRSNT